MEYAKERKAIVEACRWLEANEMVIGTWGNVSARLDGGKLLVTPSRVAVRLRACGIRALRFIFIV